MTFNIFKIPKSKNHIYFWITFSIYFIFQFISAIIANYFNPDLTSTPLKFNSLAEEFIIVVIIAPIIETLIYQYLIIETLLNKKITPIICVIVSGLLFGVSHWYNLAYVGVLTIVGFIFAYYYLALHHQKYYIKIIFVILLHALSNTIAFVEKNFISDLFS